MPLESTICTAGIKFPLLHETPDGRFDDLSKEEFERVVRTFQTLGVSGSAYSKAFDVFDVANNTWSSGSLSAGKAWMSATVLGDKGLFAGGDLFNAVTNAIDIYQGGDGTLAVHF